MSSREDQVAGFLSRIAGKYDLAPLAEESVAVAAEESAGGPSKQLSASHTAAAAGLQEILRGRVPAPEQSASIEAIILPKIRPVLDVIDGDFHTDHPLWQKLNDDHALRTRLRNAIPSIGRIELPGNPDYPYGGTGFVVGDDLIMTNRHVAEIFASGLGARHIAFKTGLRAGIDFLRELDRPIGPTLMVRQVVMVHPYWDMALLKVEGLNSTAKPLALSLSDVPAEPMAEVAAIGYPAFDDRNDPTVQNDLFRSEFGVKRLLPGTLGGRQATASFGKMVSAVRHNCSTLGGNSGSALIDFESGEVVALHFGGRYRKINYGVPTAELARDGRVVDAGVQFAGTPPGGTPAWQKWWADTDETVALSPVAAITKTGNQAQSTGGTAIKGQGIPNGSVQVEVPLILTISLGGTSLQADLTASAEVLRGADTEAMTAPWHDQEYASRSGYNPQFIDPNITIPMPVAADSGVVARVKDGSSVLHYQNFSIVTHAKRRLALVTASNVTAEAKLKRPEAGRDYSRKGLSGLGKSDQELWFTDPRLDDMYQLTDVFYTKDDGAFDKGHIVRREDVAWGGTYDLIRRANGDTYHVTNCSPQVANFNRSNLGEDNWGGLENHVLKSASSERYCQFAGPVLDAHDEVFVGRGKGRGVIVKVKIPSRFWKVIVATTTDGVASYGFELEQNLSDVPFEEFVVPRNFKRLMVPLSDIEERSGIKFPDIVRNADQFDTHEGLDLAFRAGVSRRSKGDLL